MRVITQDGFWDIPYEEVVLQRYEECIYFVSRNLGEAGEGATLAAEYSTEEKAEKAMELLHLEWRQRGTLGFFRFPENEDV